MARDALCSQHFEYGSNNSHVTLRHNMRLQSAPPPRTLHVTLIKLEGFVDDATATVERYKAETLTTFGTRMSKLSHDDPERLVSPANT